MSNNLTNFKTSYDISDYMDKEAFLRQLESAVANNDKKLFIDTIFDLPADVILSFSKDEFLRIMNVSSQIYLDDADELFGFLDKNGLFFIQNGLNEVDEFNDFTISKFYYNLLIKDDKDFIVSVKRIVCQ